MSLYRGALLEGWSEEWVFEERSRREQAFLGALERLAIDAIEREDPGAAQQHLRQVIAVDPLRESAQRALMQALAVGGSTTAATQVYQELRRRLHRELNAQPDAETTALFQQLRAETREKADRGSRPQPPRPTSVSKSRSAEGDVSAPRQSAEPGVWSAGGTVTFLLTDIEGSTRHWLHDPDAMRPALDRHDAIAAALIAQHHGILVKHRGEGDSLFAVFSRAIDAVAASLELQRAFLSFSADDADDADEDSGEEAKAGSVVIGEPSAPDSGRSSDASHLRPSASSADERLKLQVRIALHTGDAELRDEDYYGPAVNHCARLRAAGHGGQVLLSQTTAALVRDHLPEGASLRELGTHRLKDLQRPEPIFQLAHPELPGEFPPLKSLEAFAHNLPVQLTRFIGREHAIAEVERLLPTTHLLTLTGAGGCGKTRLALQVAADQVEEYADGVWLVELAPLSDPALVPQRVASALGAREEPGRSLAEALTGHLRSRSLLLVLDNCEHLLSACAGLADRLLSACPNLRILATSRETLGVSGEQSYLVPSLSVPEPGLSSVERLGEFEAVQLFIDRALLCQPTFNLTSANAVPVVEVCQRLGGIPLAIELAAARLKMLPEEQIARRLDDRFRLLTGGSRTALPRHQTLRALMDWSYDLLNGQEKGLLQRLSVFAGSWTLEAAEAVCSGEAIDPHDVLDLLGQLVDKSLVQVEEAGSEARYRLRYRLLETIRQYGAEKLRGSGEEAALRGRHRDWFLALAEQAEPELQGRGQGEWLARLEGEHDNLRAALTWCTEQGDAEAGLRLGGALWRFWMVRGYMREGRERLTQLLSLPEAQARTVARGRALRGAGALTCSQVDYEAARALYAEGLAIFRELGDQEGIAWSISNLGDVTWFLRDHQAGRALWEESLAIFRELGDQEGIAYLLGCLGNAARDRRDYDTARALLEESLAIAREVGNHRGIVHALHSLGGVAMRQGEYEAARVLLEESLTIAREVGSFRDIVHALGGLGHVEREAGEYARCAAYYRESMALRHSRDDRGAIARALEDFAGLAGRQRQWARAVRLLGAAEAVVQTLGGSLPVAVWEEYQRTVDGARSALGEAAFAAAWAAGRALTLEQAVCLALEQPGG